MLVSVIIPIYNVEAYIERCIRSVLRQTYTHIEVILVDDCTPDGSMKIAKDCINDYHSQNPSRNEMSFVYLQHSYNRGLSAARNTGVEAASGDYVFLMDSDDELPDNSIELLCQEVYRRPGIEMVQGLIKFVHYNDSFVIPKTDYPYYIEDNTWIRYGYYNLPSRIIPVYAWNKLILKSFITRNRLRFKEGLLHEDELWMYEAVKVLRKYAVIGSVTYVYSFYREGGITKSETAEQKSFHWNNLLNEVLNKLDEPCKELQLLSYTLYARDMLNVKVLCNRMLMMRFAIQYLFIHSYKIAIYLLIYTWFYPRCSCRLVNALSMKLVNYSEHLL